jgi:hypothetical protein
MAKKSVAETEEEVAEAMAAATPAVNTPLEAPTIFADVVQGVMISDQVVKIFFLEQIIPLGEKEVKGRYVANLTLPTPQLRQIGEVLIQLADKTGN